MLRRNKYRRDAWRALVHNPLQMASVFFSCSLGWPCLYVSIFSFWHVYVYSPPFAGHARSSKRDVSLASRRGMSQASSSSMVAPFACHALWVTWTCSAMGYGVCNTHPPPPPSVSSISLLRLPTTAQQSRPRQGSCGLAASSRLVLHTCVHYILKLMYAKMMTFDPFNRWWESNEKHKTDQNSVNWIFLDLFSISFSKVKRGSHCALSSC